ncbi:MAG TPA: MFS transporter, partial [Flavisolibacter sp.]|nr:MFS transporter [Flavisolibacter sp.]
MATSAGPIRSNAMPVNKGAQIPTNYGALTTLISVFFFWGFIAAVNSIFIPFCKHYFNLDQFQSQLVDFAFYTAYYIGALGLFMYGAFGGNDLVAKWGYKKSIVYGLLFSALGAVAMIIAVNAGTFPGMLVGLFIVALGFSLQQTAAQPFAISLGDPSTGTGRVNLGGGINSFGTMIGPLVVALALFGTTAALTDTQIQSLGLNKVIVLYSGVGILFIAAAALFYFSKKVPSGVSTEKTEKANKALTTLLIMSGLLIVMFVPVFSSYKVDPATLSDIEKHDLETYRMKWLLGALAVVVLSLLIANMRAQKNPEGWGAMKYPQLVLGMIAIFVYVGVEVTTVSNLGELLKQPDFGGLQSSQVAPYVTMYWGGLMIGRWTGSIAAFDLKGSLKQILMTIVPLVAFGIVLTVIYLLGYSIAPLLLFIACVA